MRVYLRTLGNARPVRQIARPQSHTPLTHAEQTKASKSIRSVQSWLQLQQQFGNRHVQRLVTLTKKDCCNDEVLQQARDSEFQLAHVIQRKRGRNNSRRKAKCPRYQPGERTASRTPAGHLDRDVIRIAPDRLLIADFGVNWRHIKSSAQKDPLLQSWLSAFESDDSYQLSIIGYSDCIGNKANNANLRQGRAERVEKLLGPQARSRVTFRGMRALGEYISDNNTAEGRARNRGVVIEFRQKYIMAPKQITVTPRHCGPDVTQWLIRQMNTNKDHPVIKTMRTVRWPRYIPFINIGWIAGALEDFKDLVRAGGPWDFKSHSKAFGWRAGTGHTCPTTPCDYTVTMCGMCFNYDVPGNVHYGWIGRAASLRSWLLHFAAGLVQPGRWTDDPKDAAAVEIGEAMWDERAGLCDELRRRLGKLNLDRTRNCSVCGHS